jgi:FkbM family methyltransferase
MPADQSSVLRSLKRAVEKARMFGAALSLRLLTDAQRRQLVEGLLDAAISEIPVNGRTLKFSTPTPTLQWRAQTALSKEPETIRWIDGFLNTDTFWDVGANVGVFSIYAAAVRGLRVLAFEPSADNYAVLCRNVELNKLSDAVVPYCIAFSDATELAHLNSASRTTGAALHQFGRRGDSSAYWPASHGSCVQGMVGFSIDDFVQKFDPSFPTHLKIDVDGLELDILRGAANALCDRRLSSVMVELSMSDKEQRDSGMQLLAAAGFQLDLQASIQESAGATAANHFFKRTRA